MRHLSLMTMAVLIFTTTVTANAAVIPFLTDPFAGSTALTTPGRQIVGGGVEPFVTFNPASDTFVFDPLLFGGVRNIVFANDIVGNLPTTGVNFVVLRTFDNDANTGTPFGAGNAADLIADRFTTPGPGFFIYFNSGLDLPRLVYSTDLNDNTADLKILARITNFAGNTGAMATFTAANLIATPEPSSFVLISASLFGLAYKLRRRRPTDS